MPLLAPTVLPGRAFQRINRVSRLLFHWRANDLDLTPVTGEAPAFSRAGAGGAVAGRNGLWRTPVHSQPRWRMRDADGDGVFETPALLLEQTRTNNFTFSDQLDNAVWSRIGATVTPNAATGPDGLTSLDRIVEDNTNGPHGITRTLDTAGDNASQSLLIVARAGERTWLALHSRDKANVQLKSYVNLATGTLGTVSVNHTVRIRERLAGGIYVIEFVFNVGVGATVPQMGVELSTGDAIFSYQGDGASSLYVAAVQWEKDQPFASSYVASGASATQRLAEALNWPFRAPPGAMAIYVRLVELGTAYTPGARILHVGAGANVAPRFYIAGTAGNKYQALFEPVAGTQPNVVAAASPNIGDRVELRALLLNTGAVQLGQSINGGPEVIAGPSGASSVPGAWSDTQLWLGGVGTIAQGFAAFESVKIASGAPSMDQLRRML